MGLAVFAAAPAARAAPPPNDDFANAEPLTAFSDDLFYATGTNREATREANEPSGQHESVWYEWTATASGPVSLHICHSSAYQLANVHVGESLSTREWIDATQTTVRCGYAEVKSFEAVAGETYKIAVYNPFSGAGGDVVVLLSGQPFIGVNGGVGEEGDPDRRSIPFPVVLSHAPSEAVSFAYATRDGSAQAPGDYQPASGVFGVPAGEVYGRFSVAINDDSLTEPPESFHVDLGDANNGWLVSSEVSGHIADDEPQPLHDPGRGPVRMSSSGDRSELVKSLPITKGGKKRVVMRIPAKKLRLRRGDAIQTSAEVQVSVTCLEPLSRCVGTRYRYSPQVVGRMVLTRGAKSTSGIRVSKPQRLRCSQARPHRNHHCVVVFPPSKRKLSPKRCAKCDLSLTLAASHKRAKPGHRLVIGSDAPNGIQQDRGRLNAVALSPAADSPAALLERTPLNSRLSVAPRSRKTRRQVVYSLPIGSAYRHEQFSIEARGRIRTGHLPYSTFIGSHLVLADQPAAVHTPRRLRRVASFNGQLSEKNGFNCTRKRSAHASPCLVRKVGLLRIKHSTAEPLYINLVAELGARYGGRWRSRDAAAVMDKGAIRASRYPGAAWTQVPAGGHSP